MTSHLIGRDVTMSIQVGGEWVNVGTVGHLDYPKAEPAAGVVVLYDESAEFNARMIELLKPAVITGKRLKPLLAKRSPKTNKLFDRWGRLK